METTKHTIVHSCGHTEIIEGPERFARLVAEGKYTQERIDEIFRNKCSFLASNVCPACWIPDSKANDRPDLKGWVYSDGRLIYRE